MLNATLKVAKKTINIHTNTSMQPNQSQTEVSVTTVLGAPILDPLSQATRAAARDRPQARAQERYSYMGI